MPNILKYLKTELVEKDDIEMYEELTNYSVPLVILEEGYVEKSGKYSIVLDEDDLDMLEEDIEENNMENLKTIYKGASALSTGSQEELLLNYEFKKIPEYYYEKELEEEGNVW